MTLPKFLCIGAQKAGTTWLFEQLIRNPGVWMPPVKELHFFDHVHVEQVRSWTPGHIQRAVHKMLQSHLAGKGPVDWRYVSYLADMAGRSMFTPQWYQRCFDRPKANSRVCGDITPAYCAIGEEGIRDVLAMLPGVKVMYIVRHPVQRALSQLRMNVARRTVEPDGATLLKMCDEWDLLNRGDYLNHIPKWRDVMPANDLLIIPFGGIRADPAAFMRTIEQFIGVDAFNGYHLDTVVHQSRKIPIPEPVMAYLSAKLAPQVSYLENTFGRDFLEATL